MILLIGFFFQEINVPYKSSDEFNVTVDITFKTKPNEYGSNTYAPSGDRLSKTDLGPKSYLSVTVSNVKTLTDEYRVAAIDSNGKTIIKRKLPLLKDLQFDLGFVDDLIKKLTPHEIVLYFIAKDGTRLRKIVLTVQDDGTFLVNGNWRGKF